MMRFNTLLREAGIDPVDVRLLRHQAQVGGRSLLDIWRIDRPLFEAYQAHQLSSARTSFARRYWASFIGTWDGRTVFAGLYEVDRREEVAVRYADPITGEVHEPGAADFYATTPAPLLRDYLGRLYIDWGGGASGKRAWNQRADAQDKQITELHATSSEQPFPGLLAINMPLSELAAVPPTWIEHLAGARGIYLLSCPRDGSLYIGSATAADGFWARWSDYCANGHGGNLALVDRAPSDFYASILQLAGSADTVDDILVAEARWKDKLRTREWGLNRN